MLKKLGPNIALDLDEVIFVERRPGSVTRVYLRSLGYSAQWIELSPEPASRLFRWIESRAEEGKPEDVFSAHREP